MNPYRCAISLRIRHPSADPTEFTSTLGYNPLRCWRAGEPRTTPKGTPLEGRWPDTYWTSGSIAEGRWPGTDLASTINDLLDQLSAHRDLFHRVAAGGGRAELFIGWYLDGNGGDVLSFELMGRLTDLKIDVSIDVYPPDEGGG